MRIPDISTPVVVLNCDLGAIAIMRTLGRQGVDVYGVSNTERAYGLRSRYCRRRLIVPYGEGNYSGLIEALVSLAQELATKPVLIATSDETSIAVAENYDRLSESYLIAQNGGSLVATLADKMSMFGLAKQHSVPTPNTTLPQSRDEAVEYARTASYPVVLKGAMGNRLYQQTGKKMVFVGSEKELLEQYDLLEDPARPNLMIQEVIPGGDDQVFIFNGYFDRNSDCLLGFTGRKIRQYPIHVGCASLGECCWVPDVADLTTSFMKEIGYRGILDIGYRLDPRDGKYKVLDINPRVGQAFRIFVTENDHDVVKALYLDLTGQDARTSSPRREGRRWMIEDYDITSSVNYFQEGTLTFGEWFRSLRSLEEGAWFSLRDPVPFIAMLGRLLAHSLRWVGKRLTGRS